LAADDRVGLVFVQSQRLARLAYGLDTEDVAAQGMQRPVGNQVVDPWPGSKLGFS